MIYLHFNEDCLYITYRFTNPVMNNMSRLQCQVYDMYITIQEMEEEANVHI